MAPNLEKRHRFPKKPTITRDEHITRRGEIIPSPHDIRGINTYLKDTANYSRAFVKCTGTGRKLLNGRYDGSYDESDIAQMADIGTARALMIFDPEKNASFTTYRVRWMRTVALKLENDALPFRLLGGWHRIYRRYAKIFAKLATELKRFPDDEEIRQELGWTSEKYAEFKLMLTYVTQPPIHFESAAGPETTSTFHDTIADSPHNRMSGTQWRPLTSNDDTSRDAIIKAIELANLTTNQLYVVVRYFGLDGIEEDRQQIGRILGVFEQSVDQIKKAALKKIKPHLAKLLAQ